MRILVFRNVLLIATLFIVAFAIQAQTLSQSNIDQYVKTMKSLIDSDNPDIKSIEAQFSNNPNFQFDIDESGSMAIMSQMLKAIDPKQMKALNSLIRSSGFSSVESWANVGDKVSAAMMAIQIQQDPSGMPEITPEMLAMMPEAIRQQMAGALRMMKAVEKIPSADIAIVKANYKKLEALMEL